MYRVLLIFALVFCIGLFEVDSADALSTTTLVNLTAPADTIHQGDVVGVFVNGAPDGVNFVHTATYAPCHRIGSFVVYCLHWATPAIPIRGSGDAWFVARAPGILQVWLDNDIDPSNGILASAGALVLPPR